MENRIEVTNLHDLLSQECDQDGEFDCEGWYHLVRVTVEWPPQEDIDKFMAEKRRVRQEKYEQEQKEDLDRFSLLTIPDKIAHLVKMKAIIKRRGEHVERLENSFLFGLRLLREKAEMDELNGRRNPFGRPMPDNGKDSREPNQGLQQIIV